MKKLLSLILVITLLCSMSLPALAADKAIGATLRLEKTEGTVAVKNASGKAQSVKASMRLYSGYTTATEKKSYAYISLDDSKVVKLDALSEVEVQQSGKKLEVMLSKGSLMFDVSEKLKSDESLNIRTSTMLTGVRGTIGIVTVRGITVDLSKYDKVVLENGDIMYLDKLTGECVFLLKGNGELYQSADGSTQNVTLLGNVGNTRNQNVLSISATDIYLLEGELEVKTISGQTVTLTAGQKATVDQVDGTGEVIIRIDEAKLTDTNGSAQMMIADSPEIQQRLSNGGVYTPEQVKEAVENAPEALKQEQAEQEASLEGPAQRDKSVVPAFENNTPESSGGGTYASTVTLDNPSEQDVRDALAAYTVVNVTNANVTTTAALDIPAGKTLNLNSGEISNNDASTVFGTLNVVAGATLTNDGTLTIASTNSVHVYGTLANNGTVNVGTAGRPGLLEIAGTLTSPVVSGTISIKTDSTLKISSGGETTLNSFAAEPGAKIINAGSFTPFDGTFNVSSEVTPFVIIENSGTFTANSISISYCEFTNSSTGEVITDSFDLNNRSSLINSGDITAGMLYAERSSTLTNSGTISVGEGIDLVEGSTLTNSGNIDAWGIVLTESALTNSNDGTIIISDINIDGDSTLTNNGTITSDDAITIANDGTLTNNGTVSGPGTVTVTGSGTFDGSNKLSTTTP